MNGVGRRWLWPFRRRLSGAHGRASLWRPHCRREPIAFKSGQTIEEIRILLDSTIINGKRILLLYNALPIFSGLATARPAREKCLSIPRPGGSSNNSRSTEALSCFHRRSNPARARSSDLPALVYAGGSALRGAPTTRAAMSSPSTAPTSASACPRQPVRIVPTARGDPRRGPYAIPLCQRRPVQGASADLLVRHGDAGRLPLRLVEHLARDLRAPCSSR